MTDQGGPPEGSRRPEMVSIVMVVRNAMRYLRLSLPTLLDQEVDLPVEIVVIDSSSSDGSPEYVRALAQSDPRLRLLVIDPSEFHYARTRNKGADIAKGRFIVYVNGDCVPIGTGFLSDLVRPLRANGAVAATYGRQVPGQGAGLVSRIRMSFNYGEVPAVKSIADGPKDAKNLYFFSAAACALDSHCFGDVIFDEAIPVYEDMALAKRIITDGGRIAYVPQAVAVHSHEYSPLQLMRRYYDSGVIMTRINAWSDDSSPTRSLRAYIRHAAGHIGWSPLGWSQFLTYLAASGVGYALGLRSAWLPAFARRFMSLYGTAGPPRE